MRVRTCTYDLAERMDRIYVCQFTLRRRRECTRNSSLLHALSHACRHACANTSLSRIRPVGRAANGISISGTVVIANQSHKSATRSCTLCLSWRTESVGRRIDVNNSSSSDHTFGHPRRITILSLVPLLCSFLFSLLYFWNS